MTIAVPRVASRLVRARNIDDLNFGKIRDRQCVAHQTRRRAAREVRRPRRGPRRPSPTSLEALGAPPPSSPVASAVSREAKISLAVATARAVSRSSRTPRITTARAVAPPRKKTTRRKATRRKATRRAGLQPRGDLRPLPGPRGRHVAAPAVRRGPRRLRGPRRGGARRRGGDPGGNRGAFRMRGLRGGSRHRRGARRGYSEGGRPREIDGRRRSRGSCEPEAERNSVERVCSWTSQRNCWRRSRS